MGPKQIQKIKQELEGKLARLKDKIVRLAKIPRFGDSQDDNAQEVTETANNVGLKADLQIEVKEIEQVLKMVDKGKYGICQKCGQSIEPNRLKLIPTAVNCANCQGNIKTRKR